MKKRFWIGGLLLVFSIVASAQQVPVYDESTQTLTLPVVDTLEQRGRYQDVVLQHIGGNRWQIVSAREGTLIRRAYEAQGQVRFIDGVAYVDFSGYFGAGCEALGLIRQHRYQHRIDLVTYYEDGPWLHEAVSCTMALVPFRKQMTLDTKGLAAGDYEVTVNGFSLGSFTLDAEHACTTSCNWIPLHDPLLATTGQLNVPVVDTQEQVGAYHGLSFVPTQEADVLQLLRADIGVPVSVLSAAVTLSESFPLQARLTLSGQFTCYPPGLIEQRRHGNEIDVAVLRSVLPDTAPLDETTCGQAVEHFERTLLLDTYGLNAGEYQFRVNGTVFGSFVIAQDNRLP